MEEEASKQRNKEGKVTGLNKTKNTPNNKTLRQPTIKSDQVKWDECMHITNEQANERGKRDKLQAKKKGIETCVLEKDQNQCNARHLQQAILTHTYLWMPLRPCYRLLSYESISAFETDCRKCHGVDAMHSFGVSTEHRANKHRLLARPLPG